MTPPKVRDYPVEVAVGDSVYELRFVRSIPEAQNAVGLCDEGAQVIKIAYGQSPRERFRTFLHELLHAVDFEYKLRLPHRLIYRLEGPLADALLNLGWRGRKS
jgi:hypothetical protein